MKRENFYRRNPGDALSGMVGMTLEERGVYNTIIDLVYLTWRPLEDSRQYIAGHCGCAVQKLNPIISSLIAKRKLLRFEEGGVWYLSNRRFEDERSEVKGPQKTRSGRGEVGEKSGEVGQKSAGVGENLPLLEHERETNHRLVALDRVEEEKREAKASLSPGSTKPKAYPDLFEAAWKAYPHVKGRSSKADTLARWRRLPEAQREALPRAAAAYARDGREPRMDCGAPAMDRWLKGGKFEDWIGPEPGAGGADWPESRWLIAVGLWRSEGAWGESLGPNPGQPGCRVPPHLLIQPTANGSAA